MRIALTKGIFRLFDPTRYYTFLVRKLYHISYENNWVLQIGSKTGVLCDEITTIIIEPDEKRLLQLQLENPHLKIYKNIQSLNTNIRFDQIILANSLTELGDIYCFFYELRKVMHERSRVIIVEPHYFTAAIKRFFAHAFSSTFFTPTFTTADINHFLALTGYDLICQGRYLTLPIYIPLFSYLVNEFFARLPGAFLLTNLNWLVARPREIQLHQEHSVSIVIPCRNERGTIEHAVKRLPQFGTFQELIFVDGNSHDQTFEEIQRIQNCYPEKKIFALRQTGRGKANAVREGLRIASGDIVMILDSDLTTPPEEMTKFYQLLISKQAEFVNGSRLIYPMEKGAMQFLNLVANYSFALGFSWLARQRMQDTLCGTKVLWKRDYEKIIFLRDQMGIYDPFGDFDLILGAIQLSLKIMDMPVHYKNRMYGSTQIRRFYNGYQLLKIFLQSIIK